MLEPPLDLQALPKLAQRVLADGAPRPMRLMAAKGVAPGLKPDHLITVIAALSRDSDEEIRGQATATLEALPGPLKTVVRSGEFQTSVIDVLADHFGDDPETVGALTRMRNIGESTFVRLAERADEARGEVLATNESRLLEYPRAIEKLYMNKRVRMSTTDRLVELAVRNGIQLNLPAWREIGEAIQNELIVEATDEPTYDDQLFRKTDELANATQASLTDAEELIEVDDEGKEQVVEKIKPLFAQLGDMSVTQKIRRAMLGTGAERMLLVREKNRLVATAAASSPLLKENEAARIAASRNVIDDVLRVIARNKEFMRSYQVKLNLVQNPRTPLTFSARLIPHLRQNDLKALVRSKNIPAAVKSAARQQMQRKK